jgi:hypothetical protein
MTELLEQRYCIKLCQKLGDTQVKTIHKIQQAFGDDAMSISRLKEWFNRFKHGRTSVDSELRTLVMQGRRITVQELAIEVGVR